MTIHQTGKVWPLSKKDKGTNALPILKSTFSVNSSRLWNHTDIYLEKKKNLFSWKITILERKLPPGKYHSKKQKKKNHIYIKRWSLPFLNSAACLKREEDWRNQERAALEKPSRSSSTETKPDVCTSLRVSRERKAIRCHLSFFCSQRHHQQWHTYCRWHFVIVTIQRGQNFTLGFLGREGKGEERMPSV